MLLYRSRFALALALVPLAAISLAQTQYAATVYPNDPYNFTMANGIAGGQVVGLAWSTNNPGYYSGFILNAGTLGFTDITYPGWNYAYINGTDGVHQAGVVGNYDPVTGISTQPIACIWSGSSASAVLLGGAGAAVSVAMAVDGNRQVGYFVREGEETTGNVHPCAWQGSAATFQDLTPPDAAYGFANSVKGDFAVGTVGSASGSLYAVLWDLAAGTSTNLSQPGWSWSYGYAVDGSRQGGAASYDTSVGSGPFATIWSGTSASAVDINPSGALSSFIYAMRNGKQAGLYVLPDGTTHAVVWSGTSASAVDLQQFLPAQLQTISYATGIDENGTICGFAYDSVTGQPTTVTWAPVQSSFSFGSGFQQPLNDPASPMSVAKKGSTLPVKFHLTTDTGAAAAGLKVTIALFRVGATDSAVNESDFVGSADTGSLFRDQGNGNYIYNLSTAGLQAGSVYRVTAVLPNGQSHSVTFGLR